jgi:prenyltransferase beta subunit
MLWILDWLFHRCNDFIDLQQILGYKYLIQNDRVLSFLEKTKTKHGGYGKNPGTFPDIMHSYMGLVSFKLCQDDDTNPFFSALGVSQKIHAKALRLNLCGAPK